ncbi:hypothetical protein KBC04_03015 [Candidatus Babeliales bacterium]|nr:hypothetical protein [Candidatus Babeliales bacterium]MBP9843977.1 hypothetical protein [Candidatus Babeliales bacterium]
MKKINFMILTLLITSLSNVQISAKAQNALGSNPLATNIDYTDYTIKTKLKRNGPLEFTPDNEFGGPTAQGIYNFKNKTATIVNGNKKYSFIRIKENPSPSQPEKKNFGNLVIFGSFVNGITRGMPVTMYLFGELTDQVTPSIDA